MCRRFAIFVYFFLTLPSVLSTPVLWSQETAPSSHWSNSLPNAPSAFKPIRELQKGVPFTFRRFAIGTTHDLLSGTSLVSWSNTNTSLEREGQADKECDRCRSLAGVIPRRAMVFAPKDLVNGQTAQGSDELEHYIHHIPLAGPIILRISKEPHLTRVLRVVQPEF